jgi:uncharacterized protein with HEPN domain
MPVISHGTILASPLLLTASASMLLSGVSGVIGEVSKRLSPETKQLYSSIEWSAMARMRDMLIHSYGKVDLDDVWETTARDIPGLIASLEADVRTDAGE